MNGYWVTGAKGQHHLWGKKRTRKALALEVVFRRVHRGGHIQRQHQGQAAVTC
jgi:hypothetical protein